MTGRFHISDRLPVYDFYTNLNEFYGVLSECCTQQSCPTMSAGTAYVSKLHPSIYIVIFSIRLNYTWINQDRKSVNLPAPTYIDYVMTWVQNLLDDESVFPTKSGSYYFQPHLISFWLTGCRSRFCPQFPRYSQTYVGSFFFVIH